MKTATAKILVISAALATTAAFAVAQTTKFSDIPAGHWATQAVEAIAADGLITGYQDGTFQGTRNLTRYEAATIFYRLLQSGKLQAMPATTQTTVQQGIAEVGPELTALTTRVTALETGNDTRLKALEDQIGKLTAAPATGAAPATTEASAALEDRIAAIEEEITKLRDAAPAAPATATTPDAAGVETRIAALETELAALKTAAAAPASATGSADLEARLKALEDKVAAAPAAPATTTPAAPAASSDVDARLTALEAKIAALPTTAGAPTDATALTATVAAQDARIVTLESALTKLQADVEGLKTSAATTTTTPPATTTPDTGSSATVTPAPSSSSTRFSLGLGGATNISGPVGANASPFGLYGQLGITNLVGPIGLRAFADLSSVPTAGAQLMLNLGDSGFDPYIGVGGGVVFGGGTNFFVAGSVGANLGLGGGLGVFAEINPRYNLSASQFSIKGAFGIRFSI